MCEETICAEVEAKRRKELDRLFSAAYEELKRLASSVKHSFPNSPLSPSTLVNAAWVKLSDSMELDLQSELHFKCVAAIAMRRVLVETARWRSAQKRGGGAAQMVTLDDAVHVSCDRDLVALDDALNDLATVSPRQGSIVELRFFGGCDVTETAAALKISATTVEREWRAARAWLALQVRRGR